MTIPTYGTSLNVTDAAAIIGVPATQLARWAWDDWDTVERKARGLIGPLNTGSRQMPSYAQEALDSWKRAGDAGLAAVKGALESG